MAEGSTGGPFRQVRIDTWKSIARYLERSTRTVQRWHREYGLPAHRLGVDSGSIFAYADELDSWLRNRDRTPNHTILEISRPTLSRNLRLQTETNRDRAAVELPCVLRSGRQRSAALCAFADKLWASASHENLKIIAKCFREAIDLDPGNADAFAGMAHALMAQGLMGILQIPSAYATAKAASQRALEIDAELPSAKCAGAMLKIIWDRDWHGARRELDDFQNQQFPGQRAVVAQALLHIAEECPQHASGLLREFVQRNPLHAEATALVCWSEYLAENYDEARKLIEEARCSGQSGPLLDAVEALARIHCEKPEACIPRIEALVADSPRHQLLRGALGLAFAMEGQTHKASAIVDSMAHPASGERDASCYGVALVFIGLREKREAIHWLEQSYRNGSLWSLGFPSDPILRSLRDEPSYRMLLNRMRYPPPRRHGPMSEGPLPPFVEALRISGS